MIIFTIHTPPVPQKKTRFTFRGKHPHAYNSSKKDLLALQWQIKAYAPKEPFLGPMQIEYTFYMPIPKHVSQIKRRQMLNNIIKHITKPDVDNLAYIVTNAMKGIIYKDDSQIVKKTEEKMYSDDPRIVVKVLDLNALFMSGINDNTFKDEG
jgi:Holliday junction resolvase RusA-like endonuclease